MQEICSPLTSEINDNNINKQPSRFAEKLHFRLNQDHSRLDTIAIPLGIQHVLAMFASNVTPAIIVFLAAGFSFGSAEMVYMIQIVMVFAGISTLLQTVGLGPVGARLPVVQGTSFAFIPIMIPIVKTAGMAALFGGVFIGGIFHFFLGTIIGRRRNMPPPLVTGVVVLTIGLSLIPVGIKYAAGGGVIVMFGMVVSAGITMLSEVDENRRNMLI